MVLSGATTCTMISSIGSISFIDRINQYYTSKRSSKELAKQAKLFIGAVAASPKVIPQWLRRFEFDLDLFLRTLLECVPTSLSRRYVASAILGCIAGEWHCSESVENLRELALNWFGHLFWTFKSAGADGMLATSDDVLNHYIREAVLRREGYRCLVTGVYDWQRAQRHQVPKANMDYACILPRTARPDHSRDDAKRSIHDYFSPASWDIFQHYMSVAIDDEEVLLDELESPANAVAMELDAGYSFQQFYFSLETCPGQVPDNHVIVPYDHEISDLCAIAPLQDRISLYGQMAAGDSISSPSPLFLQIHATIAKVLYFSRAGIVIDRINDYLGQNHPVLQRLDFESARMTLELNDSVEKMFANLGKEKKRESESESESDGTRCKKFEASVRRELKRRKLV